MINDTMLAGSLKQLKGGETGMMSPNTYAGIIDPAEGNTLVGGDAVYLSDVEAGVMYFKKVTSSSHVPFGFVFVSHKDASFLAGSPVEIAGDLDIIWCESAAQIAVGADLIPVASGSKVKTADGTLQICGKAIDKSAGAGELIRVLVRSGWSLTAPTFSSASVTGNLTVGGTLVVTGAVTFKEVIGPDTSFGLYSKRVRVAIADVNTGIDLVAAVAGLKYRLVDAKMIAIGAAVTSSTATGVKIIGTQTTPVALLTVVKANLTQSAVAGIAGNTVLADGASFIANDANAALSIAADGGSDLAGASDIDVILTYAVEA